MALCGSCYKRVRAGEISANGAFLFPKSIARAQKQL